MTHRVRSAASRHHPGNPPAIDHLPEVAAAQAVARHLEAFINARNGRCLPTEADLRAAEDALIDWRRLWPATAAGL